MPIPTAADMTTFGDYLAQFYFRSLSLSGQTYGIGTAGGSFGSAQSAASMLTAVLATVDPDVTKNLVLPAQTVANNTDALAYTNNQYSSFFSGLKSVIQANTIPGQVFSTLDAYLTYLNVGAGGPWAALMHPAWNAIYTKYSSVAPSVWNCYFEVLHGETYLGTTFTDGLALFIVGTGFTAGYTIDGTKYAGAFPQINVTSLTGTGVVTVTGTAYDPATKTAITGATWDVTVSATGVHALVPGGTQPAPANSLIQKCTNVTADAGITVMDVYVEAAKPSGRTITVP